MTNFKDMVQAMVTSAQAELAIESAQPHKAIDRLASASNEMDAFERICSNTTVNVLSGYDKKYMDRNDFRFAHKTYRKDNSSSSNDEYFDYLLKSVGIDSAVKVRERKVVTESYDFDFRHSVDRLPWKKTAKKSTASTAVVVKKSLPQASYIPTQPSDSTTKYTATQILQQDGKTPIYPSSDASFYTVVGYKVYKTAVVLDIVPVDSRKKFSSFDESVDLVDINSIDHSRDMDEANQTFIHLVFRYAPLTATGKPNPYCGFRQLKQWLHSQKFIESLAPATIKDALEILKGSTVCIPSAFAFNYSSKSDNLTVYTVFGDFDSFIESFDNSKVEYHKISEYTERDKDENGKVVKDAYEYISQESYGSHVNYYKIIIAYECHKEFRTQLELDYSHIGNIFD